MTPTVESPVLDLRQTPVSQRLAVLLTRCQALPQGATLTVVGDEPLQALQDTLLPSWPGQLSWQDLAPEPGRWRAQVRRMAEGRSCCGCCGG